MSAGLVLSVAACGSSGSSDNAQVVKIEAQQWSFNPNSITIALARGQTVDFELTSNDVHHGFNLPDFGVRGDFIPGQTSKVRVVFDKAGTYNFHCDYFCGSGHEGMSGQIIVQ